MFNHSRFLGATGEVCAYFCASNLNVGATPPSIPIAVLAYHLVVSHGLATIKLIASPIFILFAILAGAASKLPRDVLRIKGRSLQLHFHTHFASSSPWVGWWPVGVVAFALFKTVFSISVLEELVVGLEVID